MPEVMTIREFGILLLGAILAAFVVYLWDVTLGPILNGAVRR